MKPVYFPHTYLSGSAADSLRNLFSSVVLYQPAAGRVPEEMRPLMENGFFEVVAPAAGDADDIDRFIRDFEEWGRRHQGGTGLEAARMCEAAFGGPRGAESSFYTITDQIKRRMSSQLAAKTDDTVLMARVFLQLAQTADQQRYQMAGELARYERSQAQLFDALKGGRDPAGNEFEPPAAALQDHDADDRVELRLAAWTRLFLDHPYPSPVFVTHSALLIRHLAETIEGRRQVSLQDLARVAGEASRDQRISSESALLLLEDLAAGRIALPEPRLTDLKAPYADIHVEEASVHVWPAFSPIVFFSRLLPDVAPIDDLSGALAAWRHTIILPISGFAKTTSRLDTPI